jgi:hypothetical protein
MHHHSYVSQDCGMKLNSKLYTDSKLAEKMRCGRTKATAIVQNVLSPSSIEMVLNDLHDCPFSVGTDASNKGNIKC